MLQKLRSVQYSRYIAPVLVGTLALSGASFAADGDIVAADFTALGTKILTYLGYAIAAGLLVLVAVIGAKKAWQFMQTFFRG